MQSAKPLLLALAASLAPAFAATTAKVSGEWTVITNVSSELPFNAREVPLHPAPGGFALVAIDGLWRLVPATLSAKAVDSNAAGEPQAIAIEARPADATAYLRLPGLVEGKVDTPDMRFKGVQRDLAAATVQVPLKGTAWRFERRGKAIWFTDGLVRQKIDDLPEADSAGNAAAIDLVWAGDLDRDGKLDFIIGLYGDDGTTTCVWLSSKAGPGQLAGKAACMDRAY